jgi:hypothetical protein
VELEGVLGYTSGNVATWIESNSPRMLSLPSRDTLAASHRTARLTFMRLTVVAVERQLYTTRARRRTVLASLDRGIEIRVL